MNTSLINYTLHLADNALILGHRNSEWCGHGPALEQDIAISNIALDGIGQARNLYQYAAVLSNNGATEDSLAYLRDVIDFKNLLITELPNGDWAQTTLRQFLFSAYQFYFYQQLEKSADQQLAAIATKSLKEVTYHLRWSSEWVIRLGDGTAESHDKMVKAIAEIWNYTGELFLPASYEKELAASGIAVDLAVIQPLWEQKVSAVFAEATIAIPEKSFAQKGGKEGIHTEHLGYILAEMQFLQRAYPGAEW
ncbi:1,2-phenylacetyl-CoA epoxidase subunit PaaC [Sediminibacterium sp.]|jgi:ring-1,2-phenylacetyl-CoA epoxidase subunit PaaC|uniref:1,2-phenylacetyl-CoA epoxidase subunit PaaC n=1 Tax=Sediminibacterium sp. TaxID=1917865 RepID=UPI0025D3E18E|nr:1,2-phenylacetyl-CoA epoxidase subunit PaaC [Sediminibacterium sp.]MBW0178947.1 phenylacetate-CoA oxygenase subunit PaaC [Sediminibacterium sp.]